MLAKRSSGAFGVMLPITVDGIDGSVTPADQEDFSGGVDRTSMAALGGDGYVPEIWVMAPINGTNTVRFRAPVSSDSPLKLASDTATFSPASLQEKDLQVQVAGTGTTSQDSPVTLKLGDQLDSVSVPLRVKTMKKRTVKVALHRVHGLDPNGVETVPRYFPTKEDLETYLNHVYGRQTNTFFAVTVYEDNTIDFDSNDDRKLSVGSADFNAVTANAKTGIDGFHIDVWVIGGGVSLTDLENFAEKRVYGFTSVVDDKILIDGDMKGLPIPPENQKPTHLLYTIAHEIGHVMIDKNHPGERGSNTTIVGYANNGQDPNLQKRLMCAGELADHLKPGSCLIKKEWDMIESWLKANVDPKKP